MTALLGRDAMGMPERACPVMNKPLIYLKKNKPPNGVFLPFRALEQENGTQTFPLGAQERKGYIQPG
ncbi:MAG TPA: hypothetical protein VED40_03990 [Azospirillaceae bacterium]|nr:hypothetical protein [Azospirillaceae bacterium]